ncbi:hypothetical protein [Streptomyces sp. CS62]|uniref:hypothetical protein n=1 Tax=Streptomyces sp. CS62 TaxID=3119268 RepID=UPI002F939C7E
MTPGHGLGDGHGGGAGVEGHGLAIGEQVDHGPGQPLLGVRPGHGADGIGWLDAAGQGAHRAASDPAQRAP